MVGLDSYRKGSLVAESFLRDLYDFRRGTEAGFGDYLAAKLADAIEVDEESSPSPDFRVKTLDGQSVDSKDLRGQVAVLNFWFTGCGPCIGEMPELNELVDEYKGRARFLAFARDPAARLKEFLKSHAFKYEIVPDSEEIADLFRVKGYPGHYLIDAEGKIFWSAHGASPKNLETLRAMIQRLIPDQ